MIMDETFSEYIVLCCKKGRKDACLNFKCKGNKTNVIYVN